MAGFRLVGAIERARPKFGERVCVRAQVAVLAGVVAHHVRTEARLEHRAHRAPSIGVHVVRPLLSLVTEEVSQLTEEFLAATRLAAVRGLLTPAVMRWVLVAANSAASLRRLLWGTKGDGAVRMRVRLRDSEDVVVGTGHAVDRGMAVATPMPVTVPRRRGR